MMIHEVTALTGKYKARKRIGRGEGSGHGKTAGKGHKGASTRSGYAAKRAFEGGQMPFFRRLQKMGFTNATFTVEFWAVNLGDILAHPMFAKGGEINAQRLIDAGLVRDTKRPLKVMGDLKKLGGKGLTVKLNINAERVTDSVRKAVLAAGGTVTETGTRRDNVRGVDRNSDDRRPKNLTKKPKLRAAKKFDKPKAGGAGAKKGKGDAEAPAAAAAPEAKAEKPKKGGEKPA
ncbi:MAG: 50S ribosomal protein L15 [Phycisphaerales bacterium]